MSESPSVLIIEDNPAVSAVLANMVRHLGLTPTRAPCGYEGLAKFCLHHETLRIVFLDVRMPGLDGPETLKSIRLVDRTIPCYFVTGDAGNYSESDLLAYGATGILNKPVTLADLSTILDKLPITRDTNAPAVD